MRAPAVSVSLLSAIVLCTAHPSVPWNNSGHRIVSFLAWSELSDRSRTEIAKLLAEHPRFHDDLQAGLPSGTDAMGAARHAFALSANWPDTVRSVTHPMHRVAHHGSWHYIDMPFVVGDQPVLPAAAAATNDGPRNILEAIAKNEKDLSDRSLPASDRAIALCWVVHLIEDIHQPLHTCTLWSPQFPAGDKGGNSFLIRRHVFDPTSRTNLHALWDSLLGDYELQSWESCVAAGLAAQPEASRERCKPQLEVREPEAWAKESHELAIRYAYLDGHLAGTAAAGGDATPAPLPNGYLAAAEGIAMQRAVLAAHRLADVLNRIFDGQ